MKLTPEQEAVLSSFSSSGSDLIINAFAGTGKSTTLLSLVEQNPSQKFLYLAYNRAIKDEIERKARRMGLKNIEIRTFHGLGWKYKPKWVKEVRNIKSAEIREILNLEERYKGAADVVATLVYLYQKGAERLAKRLLEANKIENVDLEKLVREFHLICSRQGFVDFEGLLYILREKLRGQNRIKKKIVLVDEAQDVNNIQFEIAYLIASRLIAVGDAHQAIYGWRGAENQLLRLKESKEFNIKRLYLTKSFRFPHGSKQEALANTILRLFKRERKSIEGAFIPTEPPKTRAIISRRNTTLVDIALELQGGYRFIRPVEEIMSLPIDIYNWFYLYRPPTRHGWLKMFQSIKELEKYAEDTEDTETQSALSSLRKYKDPIAILQRLKDNEGGREPVFLTTAHSSKGLEFDIVELADDFPDLIKLVVDREKSIKELLTLYRKGYEIETIEEMNLLYVAITRARYDINGVPDWLEALVGMNERQLDALIEEKIKEKQRQKVE